MGYANQFLGGGDGSSAARRLSGAGAAGVIVADLTPDEGGPFEAVAAASGLAVVYLVAPTTPPARGRSRGPERRVPLLRLPRRRHRRSLVAAADGRPARPRRRRRFARSRRCRVRREPARPRPGDLQGRGRRCDRRKCPRRCAGSGWHGRRRDGGAGPPAPGSDRGSGSNLTRSVISRWHDGSMPNPMLVTIEHSPKKTFATAADWPGWSRSGKTEELALEALANYASRYARIAEADAGGSRPRSTSRISRSSSGSRVRPEPSSACPAGPRTGCPSARRRRRRPAGGAGRGGVAPLRRGRGGSARGAPEGATRRRAGHVQGRVACHGRRPRLCRRDRDQGQAVRPGRRGRDRSMRDQVLEVLRAARSGEPLAGKRWPARYAAHRIAWHALDHAWEIEDRSAPPEVSALEPSAGEKVRRGPR